MFPDKSGKQTGESGELTIAKQKPVDSSTTVYIIPCLLNGPKFPQDPQIKPHKERLRYIILRLISTYDILPTFPTDPLCPHIQV